MNRPDAPFFEIPAKAGIQCYTQEDWIPACAAISEKKPIAL